MLSATAVVVCALGLLGRSSPGTVPIKLLDHAPPGASQFVQGFLTREPDTIWLVTSTSHFRDAQRGDPDALRQIASVIVHEEWHVLRGPDEKGAYEAQLTTLTFLGASSNLIGVVRKSMAVVLAEQKRARRKPELTLARD
jgi:hypothetical protein